MFQQAERLQYLEPSPTRIMFRKCWALMSQGIKVTALTLGQPDFDTPEYIKEACKSYIDQGYTVYAEDTGIEPLKKAIAAKLKKENDLDYDWEEISVTTGVSQGMFAAFMAFLNPGDEVLVPDPVYVTYNQIPRIAQAVIKPYQLKEENNFQPDLAQIESLITEKTKMICLVSPSNPIGSVMNLESLQGIAELAKKHDLLVVSDEIYERLVYGDTKCISIASLPGMKERTIVFNGMSKSMAMTGWRLGYIAAPRELQEPMNRLGFYMTAGSVSFVQYTGVNCLTDEDGSIERMRQEFEKRRNYFVEEINKMKHFSCRMPEGAFYVFMNITKTGMGSQEFCDYALDNHRLAMIPGNAFGESGEGFVRLSYATSMDVLQEAIAKLRAIDAELA
ncbi:MAG: pyridoxal phosphate-dependent aminotransferase [Firmicutes bacterium]|nr:pyridoxal phosphate-dependent aminotransferase [Bacillota bacterium]